MDNNMDFDAMMENAQNVITDNRNFQYTQNIHKLLIFAYLSRRNRFQSMCPQ